MLSVSEAYFLSVVNWAKRLHRCADSSTALSAADYAELTQLIADHVSDTQRLFDFLGECAYCAN